MKAKWIFRLVVLGYLGLAIGIAVSGPHHAGLSGWQPKTAMIMILVPLSIITVFMGMAFGGAFD